MKGINLTRQISAEPTAKRMEQIIQTSSEQIKEILLEEAAKFEEFPQTFIGFKDPKYYHPSEYIEGDGGFTAHSSAIQEQGIALPKPGIVVYNADKFWTENYVIIMMSYGLYRFSVSQFMETKDRKLTSGIRSFPDWNKKNERLDDYLVYGTSAFYKMRKLLIETEAA